MKSFSYYLGIIVNCFLGKGQCIIARIQRRIQNPVKRLRSIFSQRYLTAFSSYLLRRKAPYKMFDRVLNTPLKYAQIVCAGIFVTVIAFFDLPLIPEVRGQNIKKASFHISKSICSQNKVLTINRR